MDRLPLSKDIESKIVTKKLTEAHRALAELKGILSIIPNETILINTLGIQEAKDSSAIENIITTHDDLYKAELYFDKFQEPNTKEVQNYIAALKKGFSLISESEMLTINDILEIQSLLEKNDAGFRKVSGTVLRNSATGKIIYTPPQDHKTILDLMSNLEKYINDDSLCGFDPLVKMAVIHFQFESIHPFYDGNGRTGRIINILYLVMKGLLNIPVLYLSRYIIEHKMEYYKLLQEVRETGNWENWLIYILSGIEETSRETIVLIKKIQKAMLKLKHKIRADYKFYSQELLNNLFNHPYTKIEFLENDLGVSRITAANYLNKLAQDGILRKEKLKTGNYYINEKLFELLTRKG
ncbi:MAG: Fic family protein [Candidatus Delongbacteria bacterium]|nr:Fic family protein [Candidatus Delongbacteria bacterium]